MSSLKRAGALRAAACALVCFLGLVNQAFAQTSVAGVIVSDVRWTKAQSPYLITGDVQIVGGAHVTIEPGVQVYVADGKQLVVSNGALVAVGSKDAPILFSSQKIYANQAAQRGSWGQVQFLDGTIDAATRLEYVTIEYGRGLKFVAASPAINYVTLQNNAGAAISTDLTSSPVGIGNRAISNDIDAITVPAGVVQGDLVWGLRGIQYFVPSGLVEVGSAPSLSSLTPNTGQPEESIDVQLSGAKLTGLKSITFDKPGISATIPAPATAESANAQLTIAANAATGPVALTAMTDAGEIHLANAFTIVAQQPQLLAITPSVVYVGQGNASIDISAKSLISGTEVMLDSTALSTTIISPTAATAIVPNQSVAGTLQISLRTPDPSAAGTYFTSTSLPLQVLSPELALTPSTANAQVGQSVTLKVVLPYPAPVGGLLIALSSTNASIATVPASVTVAADATEADVLVTAKALGNVSLRATRAGYVMAQASLLVTPPPALSLSPSIVNVAVGTSLPASITLVPAPMQDTVVALSSNNPGVFTVPVEVTVPAGTASVPFAVSGVGNGQAVLGATTPGYSAASATVRVSPKSILMPTSAVVAPGSTRSLTVALNAPAPAGGLVLALSSSNPGVLSVPASVTVAEGQASVVIAGITGVAQGTATLSASASGFAGGSTAFTVRTISIYLYTGGDNLPTGISTSITIYTSEAAPAGGFSIDLTLDNPALASLSFVRVDIPAGSNTSSFAPPQLTSLAPGTVRVTASAPGLTSTYRNLTLLPPAGVWVTYPYSTTEVPAVGKSLILRAISVSLGYPAQSPVTVTLTSSQPDKVSIPATVVIPAGQSSIGIDVQGLALTDVPAEITATAPGYDSNRPAQRVDVLPAVPYLYGMATSQQLGTGRDDVYVQLTTARGTYGSQYATVPMSIVLSLATANPLGIVGGFYADAYTSTAQSEFFLAAGANTLTAYVGSPTAAGSYSIKADLTGGGSVVGPTTQVIKPKLYFYSTQMKAVHGFRLYNNYLTINRDYANGTSNSTITVYLTSSDPTKVQVPESVTLPSGYTSARFEIIGLEKTEPGSPVTIDATTATFNSPDEKLMVDVIDPVFELYMWPANLLVGQSREYFDFDVTNGNGQYVTALAPFDVDFSIVEPSPAGIIDALYESSNASAPVLTRRTINTGQSSTYGYFGVPTAEGSFRIQYAATGYPTGVSAPFMVKPGRLQFSSYQIQTPPVLGKGLMQNFCLYLVDDSGNTVYSQIPITVTLTSSDPSKLQVPATASIAANGYSACFNAVGVDVTNGAKITIDASASGYVPPPAKLAISVAPVEWRFWNYSYPSYFVKSPVFTAERSLLMTLSPFINNVRNGAAWGLPQTTLPITLVEQVPNGLVEGIFASDGTTLTTTMPANIRTFYVGKAMQAGTYRLQTQMPDGTTVTSPVITVNQDALQIMVGNGTVQAATGTTQWITVRRSSTSAVGDVISIACADTGICTAPATATTSYYYYSGTLAQFQLVSGAEGETLLSASLPGVTPAQVNVVVSKPTVKVEYLPATVTVGGTAYLYVRLRSADNTDVYTIAPRTVTITLSANGIVSAPATVTIPANQSQANIQVNGVAKGTVTITATEPGSNSSSGSITVN